MQNQYDIKFFYTHYFGWPYQPSSGVQMDDRIVLQRKLTGPEVCG